MRFAAEIRQRTHRWCILEPTERVGWLQMFFRRSPKSLISRGQFEAEKREGKGKRREKERNKRKGQEKSPPPPINLWLQICLAVGKLSVGDYMLEQSCLRWSILIPSLMHSWKNPITLLASSPVRVDLRSCLLDKQHRRVTRSGDHFHYVTFAGTYKQCWH